jgi:hypothetical protein
LQNSISISKENRTIANERLIALWALSESGMGGLLHALQIPLKGILINGFSVIIITLIAFYSPHRFRDIIKALLIVLVIKAMVSPHTPPTAYLAVAFQGIFGAVLYTFVPGFRTGALLLALLTFLESAMQRLIMLTILFGNPLWESIDVFFDYILKEFHLSDEMETVDASLWVIGIYVSIYLLAGLLIGIFSGGFPTRINRLREEIPEFSTDINNQKDQSKRSRRSWWKQKKYQIILVLIIITLILYLFTSKYDIRIGIYVFFRTLLVIGIWYLLIAPLFFRLLRRVLKKQERKYSREVERTLIYLPELKKIARLSWKQSQTFKGLSRIRYFLEVLIAGALFYHSRK